MTDKKPKTFHAYQQALLDALAMSAFAPFAEMKFHPGGIVEFPKRSDEDLKGTSYRQPHPWLIDYDLRDTSMDPKIVDPPWGRPKTSTTFINTHRPHTPRTDDMIQMLADLEAHGHGRKRLRFMIIDEMSEILQRKQERFEDMLRVMALRHGG